MRYVFLFALSLIIGDSLEACVTYNANKGTYTVSPQGCIEVL